MGNMENRIKKPPIGLIPKCIRDSQRINEILQAMNRYIQADMEIPIEWLEEYNSLIKASKM